MEDDETIVGGLKNHLEKWNYQAECMTDFKDVMGKFVEFEPQLVLLDIVLPFFNGFHWCQEIRKISKVPIIFLSSVNDNMNIVMAMNMGGDEFIEKPFDLNVVTAKVQAVLRRTYEFRGTADVMEWNGAILNLADATVLYQDQKLLIAFFKDKTREISLYAGTVGIFIVVAFLYNIRMDALKYALLLVILWLLLYVITEYHRFRKKHLLLERFKKSTQECTKELPECRNLLELDYQELLGIFDEKILELKSEARIKGQDLSDYYGMWVHQIKTPIAAMHILLQSVEDENPALPELKEMKMELFKMEQYVEMVLTYLRMEDMSGDLQFEKVSLDKILKQSVRKYSQMFILQKIRLDYRPVERIVLTDEKWLEFVTEQILSNALKYTKNGGEIRICLEEKRGRECLVIEDNGIGIQAEDLPRVFEKGFTGYNGRADKKSTGIGLYLCKKIMDKMGHKIWIDSEVGKGTRVYLELTRKEWNPE